MKPNYLFLVFCMISCLFVYSQPVPYPESKQFIENYRVSHSIHVNSYARAYYVNSRAFIFLDSFFTESPKFDGITLYFVAYSKVRAKGQLETFQSLLYVAPTENGPRPYKSRITDHDTLTKFLKKVNRVNSYFKESFLNRGIACPGICDDSLKDWDRGYSFERLTDTPGGTNYSDAFLFTPKSEQMTNRFRHQSNHEEDFEGNETHSIYLKKSTVINLANYVKKHMEDNFPLIGLYFANYNEIRPTTGGKHRQQTTLMLVPLKHNSQTGTHGPILREYYTYYSEQIKKNINYTENHGELCPSNCPDDPNGPGK